MEVEQEYILKPTKKNNMPIVIVKEDNEKINLYKKLNT